MSITTLSSLLLQFNSSSVTRGVISASLAVLLTVALELYSLVQVRQLLATKGGPQLYWRAIWANIRNNLILGPLTYHMTITYVCYHADHEHHLPHHSLFRRLASVSGIVVIEGILYYYIHKCFHQVKGLYWMHRFHHQFHMVVVPTSANAVSVAEYTLAYMIPIVMGVAVMGADECSAFLGAAVIAVTNLLIHTPALEQQQHDSSFLSGGAGWIWVSTRDHLHHHRQNQKGNYAAPVLHLDRIVAWLSKQ